MALCIGDMKYRVNGKENRYSMGSYPLITLAMARAKRDEVRRQLADGIDPNKAKKAKQEQESKNDSLEWVPRDWYAKRSPEWSESNAKKVMRRLEKDIFPYIGKSSIPEVAAPVFLSVVRRIESRSGGLEYINHVGFGLDVKRFEYSPKGNVLSQNMPDSCVAAACRTKVSDAGIDVPEAYLRSDLGWVSGEGASFRNIPQALAIPENGGLTGVFVRDTMRLRELRDSVQQNGSAITNVNGHAVLVDSIRMGLFIFETHCRVLMVFLPRIS